MRLSCSRHHCDAREERSSRGMLCALKITDVMKVSARLDASLNSISGPLLQQAPQAVHANRRTCPSCIDVLLIRFNSQQGKGGRKRDPIAKIHTSKRDLLLTGTIKSLLVDKRGKKRPFARLEPQQ